MSSKGSLVDVNKMKSTYIKWWVISMLVLPSVLDFLFLGSSIARYSRILIFLVICASALVNHQTFLSGKLFGAETILLTFFLYVIGTASALSHGGVITPNIASLLILMFILSTNIDMKEIIFKYIGVSIHILVALSAAAIILRLNPTGYFSSADGYPVIFNFIGIPGRNRGIFSHPNTLGQAAALSFLFITESKIKKIYLVVPLLCIFKCGSRTSILSILVGLLIFFTIRIMKSDIPSKGIKKLESPIAVGAFVLGIFLASSAQFLNYINFLDPSALTDRVQIWQVSLNLFKSSSMFGLGWGWEERAIQSQLLNVWAVSAHNALLEIIFSAGIVGLVIFLLMLVKSFVYFNYLTTIEKMVLSSILIAGISEAYIDLQYPTLQTYLYFMIILGANRVLKPADE
jgi:O-antigen ligase